MPHATAVIVALAFLCLAAPFVAGAHPRSVPSRGAVPPHRSDPPLPARTEDSSSSGSSSDNTTCNECVTFWNNLRTKVGCNANSTICKYVPWVSPSECQQMIDAICAAGCEANPASCAYVRTPAGSIVASQLIHLQVACCAVDLCSGNNCANTKK